MNMREDLMTFQLNQTTKCVSFLLTPLVAIAVGLPNRAEAATFASSTAQVELFDFSHQPSTVNALVDKQTFATGTQGQVNTIAESNAQFSKEPTLAQNSSFSQAEGDGTNYVGTAESLASVIGYDFSIGAGEKFSFNFNALLDLQTTIDQPGYETANAAGQILFQLFDTNNQASPSSWTPLDEFSFFVNLDTPGSADTLFPQFSPFLSFDLSKTSFGASFGGNQEFFQVATRGNYSRVFQNKTYLTLVETKENQVSVRAAEPVSTPSLLFACVGMAAKFVTKQRKNSAKSVSAA
jgi:hypothetical protein